MCDINNTKDSLLTRFVPQTLLFSIVIIYVLYNTKDSLLTCFITQTLFFNIVISICVIFATPRISAYTFHSTNVLVIIICV